MFLGRTNMPRQAKPKDNTLLEMAIVGYHLDPA
jgi:hypothetical protein